MAELTIYDSHGDGIRADSGKQSQRIGNLFFDRVRLAGAQTGGGYEIICFFRARESSAARSEQYYAVYHSQKSQREAFAEFPAALRSRIEDEYGLSFDTSTDDTEVFQYVVGEKSVPGNPLETNKLDDIVEMLSGGSADFQDGSNEFQSGRGGGSYGQDSLDSGAGDRYGDSADGLDPFSNQPSGGGAFNRSPKEAAETPTLEQARFGIGNSGAALDVAQYLSTDISGFAIAENASSNALDSYDVVIETGSYIGLELLGETAEAYQTYQDRIKQIREQRQKALHGDDDRRRTLLIAGGGALVGIIALVVVGLYAVCFLGIAHPGFLPGCDGGGDTGGGTDPGVFAVQNNDTYWEENAGEFALIVNGTLTEDGEPTAAEVELVITSQTGSYINNFTTDSNGTINRSISQSALSDHNISAQREFDITLRHSDPDIDFNYSFQYPTFPSQEQQSSDGTDSTAAPARLMTVTDQMGPMDLQATVVR